MKLVRDFIEDDLSSGSVDTCNNTPISVIDYSLYKDDNFWSSTNILKNRHLSAALYIKKAPIFFFFFFQSI